MHAAHFSHYTRSCISVDSKWLQLADEITATRRVRLLQANAKQLVKVLVLPLVLRKTRPILGHEHVECVTRRHVRGVGAENGRGEHAEGASQVPCIVNVARGLVSTRAPSR